MDSGSSALPRPGSGSSGMTGRTGAATALISHERVLLGGIVLAALVLRFLGVGSRLNIDDGYSWLIGAAPSGHVFLDRLAGSENTPPLFYVLLQPLPLSNPAWLRIPAAVPGVLQCPILYLLLRRPLGKGVALLATLATATAPLLLTYSNLARGFMLEDLMLLIALWAVLRLAHGGSNRWWWAYLLAGLIAIYTEYDSAIFLAALIASALWLGAPDRRRMAIFGPLPIIAIAPWIPQLVHAQHYVNLTKLSPIFPGPSPSSLRDAVDTLAFGEYGGTTHAAGRWLIFAALAAGIVAMAVILRRRFPGRGTPAGSTILLIASVAVLTLVGHAVAAWVGIDVFDQRYLTILIPLGAALGAAAVMAAGSRIAIAVAVTLLGALGVVDFAKRYHHQWQPDLSPVRAQALAMHPATVLTNTPVVDYYLQKLHPHVDRPFDLGAGQAQTCTRPCLIVDDLRVHTGTPRPALPGSHTQVGSYELTLER